MSSLRRHEGYLLIDNRNNEGVPADILRAAGLPVFAGRGVFEAGIITCSHCQAGVVVNPMRTRERAYCRKCDHYICDSCGAAQAASGGECRPVKQILDEQMERAVREEQSPQEARSIIVATS